MLRIKKTTFKKGVSGNPKGKPKGAVSLYKKKFMEIRDLASDDAKAVYMEIREKMKAGESWAYQLYVKELIPKKLFEQTIRVKETEEKTRVEAVIDALPQFEELTHDEAMNEIRTLTMKTNNDSKEEEKEEVSGTIEEMVALVKEKWNKSTNENKELS